MALLKDSEKNDKCYIINTCTVCKFKLYVISVEEVVKEFRSVSCSVI